MKKLTAILCLSALATGAFAQGTIDIANGSYAFARTNSTGMGGTAGNTAPTLGGFYYGVFTAPSTTTTIDANLQNLLNGTWTFTGLYATNSSVATGGRLLNGAASGTGGAAATGTTPGATNSFIVLGWSANIAGQDINAVENALRSASLSGGVWSGGGLTNSAFQGGFLGATAIGFGQAGGLYQGSTLPAFAIFGASQGQAGSPIGSNPNPSPFDMFVVNVGTVPEPGTFALAGLGAAALLIFRRRK